MNFEICYHNDYYSYLKTKKKQKPDTLNNLLKVTQLVVSGLDRI